MNRTLLLISFSTTIVLFQNCSKQAFTGEDSSKISLSSSSVSNEEIENLAREVTFMDNAGTVYKSCSALNAKIANAFKFESINLSEKANALSALELESSENLKFSDTNFSAQRSANSYYSAFTSNSGLFTLGRIVLEEGYYLRREFTKDSALQQYGLPFTKANLPREQSYQMEIFESGHRVINGYSYVTPEARITCSLNYPASLRLYDATAGSLNSNITSNFGYAGVSINVNNWALIRMSYQMADRIPNWFSSNQNDRAGFLINTYYSPGVSLTKGKILKADYCGEYSGIECNSTNTKYVGTFNVEVKDFDTRIVILGRPNSDQSGNLNP